MSTASAFSIPVGEYELLEGIEPDAVSELWVARSMVNPGRVVRLLRLKREVAENAAAREGFLSSLRAAARTRSPLVLRVLAVGEQGDDIYAVLEHLEGVTLAELSELTRDAGEPLPLGITLRIGLDVAAALESMHVAHGDLTPRSVYLTAGGIAVVSPTGLAVAACRGQRTGSLRRLAYKAPEQLESDKAAKGDARADVYALGAILIEAIQGRPLVHGTTVDSILESFRTAEIPDLDVPEKLAQVLRRALATDPAARYVDAGEFARALEAAASDLLADRREVTDSFWRLVGNDIAARRFELQSLVEHVDEQARDDLDMSRLPEMERAAERAAEAFHAEVSSVPPPPNEDEDEAEARAQDAAPPDSDEDEAEPVRASGVVGATPAPAEEPRRPEPAKKKPAPAKARPSARATEAVPAHSGRRARKPAPMEREPPSARAVENRKVVIGVVLGAAALLLLALVLHTGKTPEPEAAPTTTPPANTPAETAAAKVAPAPEPTRAVAAPAPEPAPAPAETASAEPAAADTAPEPAATDTAAEPAADETATPKKKKHKWIPLPVASGTAAAPKPSATAAAAPKSSAPPTASFGAIPGGI